MNDPATSSGITRNWPGWIRIWVVAACVVPFFSIQPTLANLKPGPGEVAAVFFAFYVAHAAALFCIAWLLSRATLVVEWVIAGFSSGGKTTAKLFLLAISALFIALWMRYDVVAISGSRDYFQFLIWDRWTGEAQTSWGECKHEQPTERI